MSLPTVRSIFLESHTTPAGERIPLNTEGNRTRLAAAYLLDNDPTMTPAMCGFWLQAAALDKSVETFKQVLLVAHRMHITYEEEGMHIHYAMAAAMRVKAQNPTLFNQLVTAP